MAKPQKYEPLNSFQRLNSQIGVQLDRNFVEIARSISQIADVLAVLSRDDSKLANATVGIQALTGDLYRFIQGETGNWTLRGKWQGNGVRYKYGDIVEENFVAYGCVVAHEANADFEFDRNQGYWQILTGDTGDLPSLAYVDTADLAVRTDILATVAQIYLTATKAAEKYIESSLALSLFLTIQTAASTYLTLAGAAQTYATIAQLSAYAPLNSPKLIGVPEAPTPALGDFTNKLATTAFVRLNSDPVGTMRVFTTSGTFVVPAGVRKIKATVVGGGGGQAINGGTSSFGSFVSATGGAATGATTVNVGVGVNGQVNFSGSFGFGFVTDVSSCASPTRYGNVYGSSIFNDNTFGAGVSAGGGAAIGVYTGFADGQNITVTVGGGGDGGFAGVVILEY